MALSPAGGLLYCLLPKKTIRQLQLIQNTAARILSISHQSSHWLPVTFRIDFKVLLLVYKSLNGLGPTYIADMLTEYKPNRPLRSLGSSQLETPRVHTKQEESAFSYYAACSWNQLPHCKKRLCAIYGKKNGQLWLPEFYRKKYGSNILGFTVLIKFTVKYRNFINWYNVNIPTYWSTEICIFVIHW